MKLYDLRTENQKENKNIDCTNPVFGWKIEALEKNIRQKTYHIVVWDEAGRTAWDSGRVSGSTMTNIPYEGRPLKSGEHLTWRVTCDFTSDQGEHSVESDETFFETGYYCREDWKGCFIGEIEDHVYHLYRKSFACSGKVKKAKLYICGLGQFECWINGEKVSDHVLEPGWSNYNKTCFYNAYDATALVKEGRNGILVKLGDGMFNVPGGRYVYYERSYGKAKFLLQLEITLEDGTKELIVTDESWKMTRSPILFCCIYGGEDYDGRLWKEEYLYGDYQENPLCWEPVICVDPPRGQLKAMPEEPLKVMETYHPVCVKEVEPGVWQYDMGRNFSGWVRIRLRTDGKSSGRKVVMSAAEKLDRQGRIDQSITGAGYAWTYIMNEEKEQEFAPDFTYTGFRYVEMTGAVPLEYAAQSGRTDIPVLEQMTGEFVYPDVETAGEFSCSNQLFNEIHKIVLQAIKSNTKSYFTDCPHREKLGWLEQTHLIGPSIMYNLNVQRLYEKIEGDMADAQRESGMVPDICPEYVTGFDKWHEGFVDSPEWGSACILAPWYTYKRYGDSALLKRYYPVMKRYLDYLSSRTHHEVLHHGLGDWLDIGPCTPNSQNTPVPVVATCIYYYDLTVMKEIAGLLGLYEDAAEYTERMERVWKEYNLQFLDDQTGRYATGSQAAQAMSLMVGLVPKEMEENVIRELRNDVIKRGYAITAGDVGHPFLIAALMKYGMSDVLNEMTNITETPGYGYQVLNGATTLTEEWDGPDPEHIHGSQNHLMLGSIEEWFYGGLGGMELIRDGLAFDEIRIRPQPQKGVDWVKAWTMHPYGKISVEWHKNDEMVEVTTVIPPNVTAHLETPDGRVVMIVGSGCYTYQF